MKKFLVSFFIVLIFGIAVFFIGLTSLRIEVDSFGILVSKTSGIDEEPIINGQLKWNWELLLPTNCEIKNFKTKPYNTQKTIKGELPSGAFYASQYNSSSKFEYKFTYDISLVVSPENVIQLLKQNKITDELNLEMYLSGVANSIAQQATDFILDRAFKNKTFRPESIRRDELTHSLSLDTEYPEVDLTVFALTECIYPDYELYKKIQAIGPLQVIPNSNNNNAVSENSKKDKTEENKNSNNEQKVGEIL